MDSFSKASLIGMSVVNSVGERWLSDWRALD